MGKKILNVRNFLKGFSGGVLVSRKGIKNNGRNVPLTNGRKLPLKISHNGQNLPLKTRFLDFFQQHFSAVFLDTTSIDKRLYKEIFKVVKDKGRPEKLKAFRYNSGGEALLYFHGEYFRFDELGRD